MFPISVSMLFLWVFSMGCRSETREESFEKNRQALFLKAEHSPVSILVRSDEVWSASHVRIQKGEPLDFQVEFRSPWTDNGIKANLEGWLQADPRIQLFAPFRRVKNLKFFQFGACIDKNLSHCFSISTHSQRVPDTSGELYFFVNDVPHFELNNEGSALVTVRPLGPS